MKIKQMVAAALAATMVMSTALTVCAADGSGGSDGSGGNSCTESSVITSSTSDDEAAPSVEAVKILSADAVVTVGGKHVTTTVAGAYLAKKVNGVAITTPAAEVAKRFNLAAGRKAYVMIYDFDQKKSHLAMDSITGAAEALGADFIAAINVNLGVMQNGKFSTLTDGTVEMVVGLPKIAVDPTKSYLAICVQPGGAVTIYEDLDENPQTVTFNVKAGLGAYAIVAK